MEILFKTVHGSRLYGLAHKDSDWDYYTVIEKVPQKRARYARQTIVDDTDSMVVDIGTWLGMCQAGVPQALEAMFSQQATIDRIPALRGSYRCGTGVFERYYRTIKSFALAPDATNKRRRHALRLALNLNELARCGRFNPTLSEEDARYITRMATKSHNAVLGLAMCLAWDTEGA